MHFQHYTNNILNLGHNKSIYLCEKRSTKDRFSNLENWTYFPGVIYVPSFISVKRGRDKSRLGLRNWKKEGGTEVFNSEK